MYILLLVFRNYTTSNLQILAQEKEMRGNFITFAIYYLERSPITVNEFELVFNVIIPSTVGRI